MCAVRTIICVGGIKLSQIEDAGVEDGRGQPLVRTWYRENTESFPVPLRSFDFVVVRILERQFIRDLQISFHAGDIDLQTRIVPFATFDLNRENGAIS
jgi:hypothetical protein